MKSPAKKAYRETIPNRNVNIIPIIFPKSIFLIKRNGFRNRNRLLKICKNILSDIMSRGSTMMSISNAASIPSSTGPAFFHFIFRAPVFSFGVSSVQSAPSALILTSVFFLFPRKSSPTDMIHVHSMIKNFFTYSVNPHSLSLYS